MKITRLNERKAISPIIATVLIIAATLIAFAAIGGYMFGIFGSASSTANISVTLPALKNGDFLAAGSTSTFTCGTTVPATSYLTLSNSGTAAASVTNVVIQWAGATNTFVVSGSCSVGAAGATGATTYVTFPTTSKLTVNAAAGQSFTGYAALSNGAQVTFTGTFQ